MMRNQGARLFIPHTRTCTVSGVCCKRPIHPSQECGKLTRLFSQQPVPAALSADWYVPRRLFPRLGCRSDSASAASAAQTLGGGGSLTTFGTGKDASSGRRGRARTKAERQALDLAVTRVSVCDEAER